MANFGKYSSYSVGRVLLHNNRMSNDGVVHSNEDIDPTRTVYNYHIKKGTPQDVQDRVSELFVLKKKDTAVMGEMIVTLPSNVPPEDERDFFQSVYEFYCKDFGEQNIINAVVHKDEKTPHLHLDFIPVLQGEPELTSARGKAAISKWKDTHDGEAPQERICCKDLITRKYLSTMHPRLSEHVERELGYKTEILNGATINGNRTVLRLKEEKLKKEIEEMETRQKYLSNEIGAMLTMAKQNGLEEADIGLYPMLQKIEDLENQNVVLKNIITRQGYSWKKEDLDTIQEKKYNSAKSVKVNVRDGSLSNTEIESNAVIVIELPNKVPRRSPQQELIDSSPDLARQIRFVNSGSQPVMIRPSRTSNQIYAFIKADNTRETIDNLFLLEKQLKETDLSGRKVYMDRLENDEYDFARSILVKDEISSIYFTRRTSEDKQKGSEKTKSKEI